jgi:hypothetical protein
MDRVTACALASVFVLACEEPPLPIPAGAVYLELRDTGADCNLVTHEARVGVVGNSGTPGLISSGTEGTEVICEVTGEGSFDVKATIDEGPFVQITLKGLSSSATEDAPVQGTLSYASSDTGGDTYSSSACSFWLGSEDQTVAPGKVWLSFSCAAVASEGNTCEIFEGYLAVENCTGTIVED